MGGRRRGRGRGIKGELNGGFRFEGVFGDMSLIDHDTISICRRRHCLEKGRGKISLR
jgi:hypothetical protein